MLRLLLLRAFPLPADLALAEDGAGPGSTETLPIALLTSASCRGQPSGLESGEDDFFLGAVMGESPDGGFEVRITGGIAASSGLR